MGFRSFTMFLLFLIVSSIILSWDWVKWIWSELDRVEKVKFVIGFLVLFMLILGHLLTPFFWHK
jgi:hypothetical protein